MYGGDLIQTRIRLQTEAAKKKFPQLIDQDPFTLSIIFPEFPQVQYIIHLPPNYPDAPPILSQSGRQFTVPLTNNWMSVFQIVNVVQQLYVRTKNLPGPPIDINENQIRQQIISFGGQIQDDNQRSKLIRSMKVVSDAQTRLDAISDKSKKQKNETTKLFDQSVENAEKLNQLNQERIQVESKVKCAESSGPQKMIEARKAKAAQLRQEALSKDSQIEELKQRVADKSLEVKRYYKELRSIMEQKCYLNLLAEAIENQQ
ncbi:hypothetical protein M9Y10_000979 [Tritrichomonas musculus]|uniref:UEV domain-containing protein n=1 Tax=Tritrichomonas musculus TaxID=1915356 RepID=A0ABR2L5R7_9EUKA